jgi:hypothetical protein
VIRKATKCLVNGVELSPCCGHHEPSRVPSADDLTSQQGSHAASLHLSSRSPAHTCSSGATCVRHTVGDEPLRRYQRWRKGALDKSSLASSNITFQRRTQPVLDSFDPSTALMSTACFILSVRATLAFEACLSSRGICFLQTHHSYPWYHSHSSIDMTNADMYSDSARAASGVVSYVSQSGPIQTYPLSTLASIYCTVVCYLPVCPSLSSSNVAIPFHFLRRPCLVILRSLTGYFCGRRRWPYMPACRKWLCGSYNLARHLNR